MPELKTCYDARTDCFAMTSECKCLALSNTSFDGDCPFCKPVEEMDMIAYANGLRDIAYGKPWGGYRPVNEK